MPAVLPVHPLTGARALGWRKARPGEDDTELHPIWPILGGAEDEDTSDTDDDPGDDGAEDDDSGTGDDQADDDSDPDGADQLGDAGKKALDSMKDKWKSEREKRRQLERQLADKDQGDGDDTAAQAAAAATAKANQRILKAEVRAAAAGKLADPRDALRLLDLDQFEVSDDGEVDADEIADAIEDLVKAKPYLAAQGGTTKRFQGTADSGARKGTGRPAQLTEADVKRLSAAGKHAEILKAREEGRLADYLGTNQ
ncbi:hypothetical protein ACFWJU_18645 [Streptomyces mutabilis]|uniref:hypothetical protein n=1 Tax=Streptomyces mutabilis TaxID=67332 RepID=UPI003663841D